MWCGSHFITPQYQELEIKDEFLKGKMAEHWYDFEKIEKLSGPEPNGPEEKSILDSKLKIVVDYVEKCKDIEELNALLLSEIEDKNRKGVLNAIESRLDDLS